MLSQAKHYVFSGGIAPQWLCRCECGKEKVFLGGNLRSGKSLSCGCLRQERSVAACRKYHAPAHEIPEYDTWAEIKTRCYNQKSISFKYYGGRGITMCERWKNSFQAFFDDMGPKPTPDHSIERKEVNGNYEPTNCIWIPLSMQAQNRRDTVRVVMDGEEICAAEASRRLGLPSNAIASRLNKGATMERAMRL